MELGLKHYAPLFNELASYELSGGHHLHMENAEQVAKLIDEFLKKLS
jgi:pimeloyl-ACP methyl ester carboxylesterase